MFIGILLIVLGFVFFFLAFPFHVLLGVLAIVLGIIDLFFTAGVYGGRARRGWY